MISKGALTNEMFKIPVISIISLIRLIDGGAAMFAAERRNHNIVIDGKMFSIPLVKKILRVWVASYVILATANRPEEESPCAIIIISAPCQAHLLFVIIPAVINPI